MRLFLQSLGILKIELPANSRNHGPRVSLAKTNGLPCQQDNISEIVSNNVPLLELDKLPETGELYVMRQDSILKDCHADSSQIRQIPEFHHDKLKNVNIRGFNSAQSLIELTSQIVKNSSSLERLVLDTTPGYNYTGKCGYMHKAAVMEALKGMEAINRYVKGKVPSRVKFEVFEPCDRCHIPKLHADL
ncbi:hypothetical protein PR202_gb18121 [Eleusine coracana subsp. coracana]|uniref:At1g61320/AtMIF1 LRR domain-containing protein n=1 Tax=Eleusine coracana subsp. coracana TaxID=191504 RepID=A0AAV5F659_ELECO|nr:hypothetical protein PR202_gb18121 [Eleusine coracana subsp. coracana]